jgi:hypothetical protein
MAPHVAVCNHARKLVARIAWDLRMGPPLAAAPLPSAVLPVVGCSERKLMLKTAFGYAALEKVVGALHEVRNKMFGAAFKVYVANISNSTKRSN